MAHIEPTPEQLKTAWLERRRHDWPPTFDAVMAHPRYSRIVRMHACHVAVVNRTHCEVLQPDPPPRTRFSFRKPPGGKPQAPLFDQKRAASGERDDD